MKNNTRLLAMVFALTLFVCETIAIASDISVGIPGLKWGESVKKTKGYSLQHCGEPDEKGEPSFYTILSPEHFQLLGISAKKFNAWTEPILWTNKDRLMGVQFDLTDTDGAHSALVDSLGIPSRRINTGTRYGIQEWEINGVVLVKGTDMRNGFMVQIYHIPSLNQLNKIRKGLGKGPWE